MKNCDLMYWFLIFMNGSSICSYLRDSKSFEVREIRMNRVVCFKLRLCFYICYENMADYGWITYIPKDFFVNETIGFNNEIAMILGGMRWNDYLICTLMTFIISIHQFFYLFLFTIFSWLTVTFLLVIATYNLLKGSSWKKWKNIALGALNLEHVLFYPDPILYLIFSKFFIQQRYFLYYLWMDFHLGIPFPRVLSSSPIFKRLL